MSYPHFHAALARERQDMLLAEAQADHRARQARSHHRRATMATRRSPFRWFPGWLPPAWRRLLTSQPESRSEATG